MYHFAVRKAEGSHATLQHCIAASVWLLRIVQGSLCEAQGFLSAAIVFYRQRALGRGHAQGAGALQEVEAATRRVSTFTYTYTAQRQRGVGGARSPDGPPIGGDGTLLVNFGEGRGRGAERFSWGRDALQGQKPGPGTWGPRANEESEEVNRGFSAGPKRRSRSLLTALLHTRATSWRNPGLEATGSCFKPF